MREKARSNVKLGVSEDAFITKTADFVNWIHVMQAFGREILCMLMYSNSEVTKSQRNRQRQCRLQIFFKKSTFKARKVNVR